MSVFDDYFARMAPDAEVWFAEMAAEPVTAHPVVVPMDQPFSFAMDTTKLSAVISVPSELLMDHGIISCQGAFAMGDCLGTVDWPCATVRQLGTEFAGHPQYRSEWAP